MEFYGSRLKVYTVSSCLAMLSVVILNTYISPGIGVIMAVNVDFNSSTIEESTIVDTANAPVVPYAEGLLTLLIMATNGTAAAKVKTELSILIYGRPSPFSHVVDMDAAPTTAFSSHITSPRSVGYSLGNQMKKVPPGVNVVPRVMVNSYRANWLAFVGKNSSPTVSSLRVASVGVKVRPVSAV